MPHYSEHQPGTFCWVDLATSDAEAAKKFYAEVFGWTATDEPAGPDMVYTRLSYGGKSVGALYKLTKEMLDKRIPPHWMSYVTVANADESAVRARELGAKLQMEPFDVMDVGRMTVIQDPTGAHFAIWQPGEHAGAGLVNEPVSFCWNELLTRDIEVAKAFYSSLFGWEINAAGDSPVEYYGISNAGRMNGGIISWMKEMGDVPPNWGVYFSVRDCDASVERVMELGGRLIVPPRDIGPGRFAVVADPAGAPVCELGRCCSPAASHHDPVQIFDRDPGLTHQHLSPGPHRPLGQLDLAHVAPGQHNIVLVRTL